MNIRHRPQGGTPYFETGFERLPANPKPGDTIVVNAVTEGCESTFALTLHWILNGVSQEPITRSVQKESTFSFIKYHSFTLGAFAAQDTIEYWFEAAGDESAASDHYRFEVLKPVSFGAVERICTGQDMLRIYFAAAEGLRPVLAVYFKDGRLHFHHGWEDEHIDCDPSRIDETEGAYTCTSGAGQCAAVTEDPFSLQVTDEKGVILYESIPGAPYMTLYRGNEWGVRQWDLGLKTEAAYFMGFGERYDTFNHNGRHVHNYCIEIFCEQGPAAYLPIPFFLTEKRFGIHIDTSYHVDMDMGASEPGHAYFRMDTEGERPVFDYCVYFGAPGEMARAFVRNTGKNVLPPKWAFGLWMSSNRWNTQKESLVQAANMDKYDIPATVFVLEAWSDECTMYLINDAEYTPLPGERAHRYADLRFSEDGKWPDFKGMADTLHDAGLKLVLWKVPVIKKPEGKDYSPQTEKDDEAAWEKGYGVMEADGTPHRKPFKWFFPCQVPDFTDPEAAKWFLEKRRYLINEVHVDGFKTDGGEFILDDDLLFHNGKTGREMRNLYTPLYLEAFQRFAGPDRVLFSRAGYTGAQGHSLYWAGDQASTYAQMRSILRGGLSLALCANPYWGFDIAGFARDMPGAELYIRSAQMAAFSPLMQYHSEPAGGFFGGGERENNDRTPWRIAEYTGDARVLPLFRYLVNLRMNLLPYIYREAVYYHEADAPMMRPLLMDYPDDPAVYDIDDQYLFGREMLVAPVLTEDAEGRDVYLPAGRWIDFFTHKEYEGGQSIHYACSLDTFPVFVRSGAVIPMNLNHAFETGGSIGNDLTRYQRLTFWVTDMAGLPYDFTDERGNAVHIRYEDGRITTAMEGPAGEAYVMTDGSLDAGGEKIGPHLWRFSTK